MVLRPAVRSLEIHRLEAAHVVHEKSGDAHMLGFGVAIEIDETRILPKWPTSVAICSLLVIAYPDVQLSLRTGPTAEMAEAVLERALDCAFVAGPLEHPDLVAHPAFQEELVLVTQRALLSLDAVAGAASNGLAALMFKVGCSYRQRLEQVLAGLGLSVYGRLEFGTLDGILGCVAAGVGVTLLPRAVVEQSAQATALRCHPLEPLHAHVETLLVLRRDAYVGAALLRLMSLGSGLIA